MFGTIRRHQTWLWIVIVTATVISFVAYFNPSSRGGRGGGGGGAQLGTIAGEPISLQDYRQAQAEVFIHYFLSSGEWPDKDATAKQNGFDDQRETYFRLFFISKFKEYNIHISPEAIGQQAAAIFRNAGRQGAPVEPETFEKQILQQRGFTLADFRRYLSHQLALQQLIAVVGMSGRLVTPDEATSLYQMERQQIVSEAVFFSPSNYLASVSVTPAMVGEFYTNQLARYRLPERVQVSYVKFNLTNYLAQADVQLAAVTNLDEQLEAIFVQRGGTNYYTEFTSFDEAKDKIKEDRRREIARYFARTNATGFAEELMSSASAQAGDLETLAKKEGLTTALTAPFGQQSGPIELNVLATFPRAAFKLTQEEPFGGPVMADDGAYIIALKKKLPSEIPALDSIRAQVQEECRMMQAARLTFAAGTNFAAVLSQEIAAGKTFAAACAEKGYKTQKLPTFSLSTRALPEVEDKISLGRLQDIAFGLPVGQTSGYVPTETGGGMILHVLSRKPGDATTMEAEFPAFLARVRSTRQGEAFNVWFGREADRALRDTPLARQREAQP